MDKDKKKPKLIPKQKVKKVNWDQVQKHSGYKKDFDWEMLPENLSIIQDSLMRRNADKPEQIAIFSQIIPENGGNTSEHGNGATGLIGWKGPRAINIPNTLSGQIHKLMEEIYNNPKAVDWTNGGQGMGIKSGKEMYNFFKETPVTRKAVNAFMRGYIRPPKEVYEQRQKFAKFLEQFF